MDNNKKMNKKILKKLQKIKALQESPNPEEVAASIEMMNKFLDKYGLSEKDIPAIKEGNLGVQKHSVDKKTKLKNWEKSLADAVATAFDCKATFSDWNLSFYGFETDIIVVKDMYDWIRGVLYNQALKKARIAYNDGLVRSVQSFILNFMNGAVCVIEYKAFEIQQARKRESQKNQTCSSEGTSLIVLKKNMIDKEIGAIESVDINIKVNFDASSLIAYESDKRAGKQINLENQIGETNKS